MYLLQVGSITMLEDLGAAIEGPDHKAVRGVPNFATVVL